MAYKEKRRNRSNIPVEAIRLYLESTAKKLEIDSVVLATSEGFAIAGVARTANYDLEMLASLAATTGSRSETRHQMIDKVAGKKPLFTYEIEVGTRRLYVASVGNGINVSEFSQTVSRILYPAPIF